jgi:plasmid maintenance system antidote protein VapI
LRAKKSPLRPTPRAVAAFWMKIQERFDLETTEDMLAPQINKIASYEAA